MADQFFYNLTTMNGTLYYSFDLQDLMMVKGKKRMAPQIIGRQQALYHKNVPIGFQLIMRQSFINNNEIRATYNLIVTGGSGRLHGICNASERRFKLEGATALCLIPGTADVLKRDDFITANGTFLMFQLSLRIPIGAFGPVQDFRSFVLPVADRETHEEWLLRQIQVPCDTDDDRCAKIAMLTTDGETFFVSKAILSQCSTQLEEWFSGARQVEGTPNVPCPFKNGTWTVNLDATEMRFMLQTLHLLETPPGFTEHVWRIAAFAQQFAILELKRLCEVALLNVVDDSKFTEYLIRCLEMADNFELVDLKKVCVHLMYTKLNNVDVYFKNREDMLFDVMNATSKMEGAQALYDKALTKLTAILPDPFDYPKEKFLLLAIEVARHKLTSLVGWCKHWMECHYYEFVIEGEYKAEFANATGEKVEKEALEWMFEMFQEISFNHPNEK